jgi:hypothetical protein
MARDDRILAFRHAVDTIGMVRKLLLSVLVVAAVGTVTWALWPATTWSAAFCKPVVRVVGKDVVAIVSYIYQHNLASYHDLASTPTPTLLRDALVNDVVLAHTSWASHLLSSKQVTRMAASTHSDALS